MEKEKMIIALDKPFTFEDKQYTEINLTGLDDMTTEDMCVAHNMYLRNGANPVGVPEFDPVYACIVAHLVTGLPIEFFKALPAKDGRSVKNVVTSYFFD